MIAETGTLRLDEHHPAADSALLWFQQYIARKGPLEAFTLMESFASVAIEGNRLAELCMETLRRLLNKEPVSDRYLLGLVWTIREMDGG